MTKPNSSLANFFLNHGGDRFCLNYFCNFQTDEILKKHELLCKDFYYCKRIIPIKFKTILNKAINEIKEEAGNILKHQLENKSLYQLFFAIYDFETIIIEIDDQ